MPTLEQQREWVAAKIKKFGPKAHCSQCFVSEEVRKASIENKPDKKGRRKTRIALECYSPAAYSAWNELMETLMERCGCNPIIVVDLLALLVHQAMKQEVVNRDNAVTAEDGIDVALHGLFAVTNYEDALRKAKSERRKRRMLAAEDIRDGVV